VSDQQPETPVEPTGGVLGALRNRVSANVGRVVVGQQRPLDLILVALSVGGHVLLEGVPGTAKTLLARSVAASLGIDFRRAQFTPDMLPSDLTGTMTLRDGDLVFRPGPVFTNILLADEINRTPPKTQSALLEAMGEGQVTIEGTGRRLADPFLVIATQNPIEYEGTYPLPEAQLDRFLVKVDVGYPEADQELAMLTQARSGLHSVELDRLIPVAGPADIAAARAEVDATIVSESIVSYVGSIIRSTRTLPSVEVGASPRAGVHLLTAAKATARLFGRDFVTPDDVAWVVSSVVAHRLVLTPEAELDRYRPADAVTTALQTVPVPR